MTLLLSLDKQLKELYPVSNFNTPPVTRCQTEILYNADEEKSIGNKIACTALSW